MILVLGSLCCNAVAQSDTGILIKQLAWLKKSYDEALKTLEETKKVSADITKVKNTIRDLEEDYNYIASFDLQNEMNKIKADLNSITGIDDFNDLRNARNGLHRINILLDKFSKRVDGAKVPGRDVKNHFKKITERYDVVTVSVEAYAKEALNSAAGDKTFKDQLAGINSATSMLASQALLDRKKELGIQIRRTEAVLKHVENDGHFMDYFSGKGR